MGAWGTAIFSDDTACDVRDEYRDYIGDGHTGIEATDKLISKWSDSIRDKDEGPVFWLALAATQWKCGRLEARVLQRALEVIDRGEDLARWDNDKKSRGKRGAVLEKLRRQLISPQPAEKQIAKRFRDTNEWEVGDLVAYRLSSGRLVVMCVNEHHIDRGGTSPVCELVDWIGEELPAMTLLRTLPIRESVTQPRIQQFMLGRVRAKERPDDRLQHLAAKREPSGLFRSTVVVSWRRLDRLLREEFGFA